MRQHFVLCCQPQLLAFAAALWLMPLPAAWAQSETDSATAHAGPEAETTIQNNETPYSLDRINKQFVLRKGQKLRIDNPWGDIRISQTGADEALLHAVVQKIGAQPKIPHLDNHWADDSQQELVLSIVYPSGDEPADVRDGRVDASILVPYGVHIEAHAERGRVLTKTMESPLTVHAKDQEVSIKSRGPLDVNSEGGDITIVLLDSEELERGRVQSFSGDIEVRYYRDQTLAVEMRSGASKSTNDLTLLQSRKVKGQLVNMHKGENPPKIYLQSDSGRIILNDTAAEYVASQDEEY